MLRRHRRPTTAHRRHRGHVARATRAGSVAARARGRQREVPGIPPMYRDGLRVTVVSELLRGELPSDGGREELHQRITATTEGPATRSSSAPLVGTVHGEAVAGERLNNAVPTAAAMAPAIVSGGWLLSERQVTGMTRRWIGVVILFGIIFAYCVIGSLMFTAIEGPLDSENMGKATTLRQIFVNDVVRQVLANSSCSEGSDGQTLIGYDERRGASLSDECRMFLSQVRALVQGRVQSTAEQFERDLVDMVKSGRYRKKPQWDFWSGWFYSGTIITTIGECSTVGTSSPQWVSFLQRDHHHYNR